MNYAELTQEEVDQLRANGAVIVSVTRLANGLRGVHYNN